MTQEQFVKDMFANSSPFMDLGLPASYAIAHAAYETGWGQSTLATKCNNYFSQADFSKPAGFTTSDGRTFKCFTSPKQSFEAYATLIKTRYPSALKAKNHMEYLEALILGGYGGYGFEKTPEAQLYRNNYDSIYRTVVSLQPKPNFYIFSNLKLISSSLMLLFCVFFLFYKK